MCQRTGTPPTLACTVGDLKMGQQYHDPNGETWMVLDPDSAISGLESTGNSLYVVNIGNRRGGNTNTFGNALNDDELAGIVTEVDGGIKLGYDRDGRLYASTYLNGWYCDPDPVEEPQPVDDDDAFPIDRKEGINLGTGEVGPADDDQAYLDRDAAAQRALEEQLNDAPDTDTTTMGDI